MLCCLFLGRQLAVLASPPWRAVVVVLKPAADRMVQAGMCAVASEPAVGAADPVALLVAVEPQTVARHGSALLFFPQFSADVLMHALDEVNLLVIGVVDICY